jgi:hypothetical protein
MKKVVEVSSTESFSMVGFALQVEVPMTSVMASINGLTMG